MNKKQIILILLILSIGIGTLNSVAASITFNIPVSKGFEQQFTGSASNTIVHSYMSERSADNFLNIGVEAFKNIEKIIITFQAPFKTNLPNTQYIIQGNELKTNGKNVPNKIDHRDKGYYLNLQFALSSVIKGFDLSDYRISKIEISYTKHPDLIIRDIVKQGKYYHVVIRNIGDTSTGNQTFYLGALNGNKTLKEFKVGSIEAGEGAVIKTKVNLKYSSFKIDNRQQVDDLFRDNNERKIVKQSDFKITKVVKRSPNTYRVTIKNDGDKNSGSSRLGTYVNGKLVKKTTVPVIKASKTKTVKVTLNSKYRTSTKKFTANYDNKIEEADNTNNSKTVRYPKK